MFFFKEWISDNKEWIVTYKASLVAKVVKNPPASAVDIRDPSSISGSGKSSGGGHINPLHYSCLENSMDRGAWWSIVHRVAKSQIRLKSLSTHSTYLLMGQRCVNRYFKHETVYKKWKKFQQFDIIKISPNKSRGKWDGEKGKRQGFLKCKYFAI